MPATSENPVSLPAPAFDPDSPLEIERVTLLQQLVALVDQETLEIVQTASQHLKQPMPWGVATSHHGSAHAQPE